MSGFPPNFSPGEFKSKCKGKHCDGNSPQPDRIRHLAWSLQRIRNEIGLPMRINSAYRCPEHNRAVGGSPGSYHPQSLAADIHIDHVPTKQIADQIEELMEHSKIPDGGLGRYKTFTHYDIRTVPARWGSNE